MTQKKTDLLKFVIFDIVTEPKALTMALNVQKIKEVVEFDNLSVVPEVCSHILGICDLRGTPIPVFDILRVMSKDAKTMDYDHSSRIVICDLQNTLIGFPVARTGRTISCPCTSFLPPPKGGLVNGRKIMSGIISRDGSYTPVLDLDSLLEIIDPDIGADAQLTATQQEVSYIGKRILVVEDSTTILKKLVQVFSDMGFSVDSAQNGSEGLKLAEKEQPYDLIFTDIEMPIMDGISMARKIKEQHRYGSVPILFNSALSNPTLISDIEQEKLGRYIVKFDKSLVLAEVAAALGKKAA